MACCLGLEQPHPSPRGEQGEEAVARVGGVGHDLSCPPQCPGVVQGLERGQGTANHPLCRTYHPLQLDEIFSRCSGEPGDDGVCEDGLYNDRIKLGHHDPRQSVLPQLSEEEQSLLGLFQEGHNVQFPFQVLGDGNAQELVGLHRVHQGASQHDGRGRGWVLPEVHHHLHCLLGIQLQVVAAAPPAQPLDLRPVGRHVLLGDEAHQGGVIGKLEELDRGVEGNAAVGVQGEQEWGQDTALRGTGAGGPGAGYVVSSFTR